MKLQLNKTLTISLFLLSSINLFSENLERYFINMPDKLNPTMTRKNRLELLEYHKAGKGDSIQNRFENNAYLETFDTLNNLIVVKNTASSTFEMKVMDISNGKPVVGIISTVCAPICQSSVEFYDTAWNKIAMQFNMPKAIQWIDNDKLANAVELDKFWVNKILENSFISLQFDAENQWIIATNNSILFLSDNDRKVIAPLLNTKPIIFELKARTWVQKP
jgi:hypothetical protein